MESLWQKPIPVIPGIHLVGRDRIAHLSADTSAMDIYVYPFGNPRAPPVLKDVSYGQRFSCGSAGSSGSLVRSLRNATGDSKAGK